MTLFVNDLRFALRLLARSPGFAAAVVLTLGLGIGAATAISSAVVSVLAGSLPFPDGGRLVFVSRAYPGFPQGGGNFSYPAFADISRQNRCFDTFAAYQAFGALALSEGPEPVRVLVNYATPSYLRLLGLRPAIGRSFLPQEDRYVDADPVVLLSHAFWQRQFGGARDIVGRKVRLNERAFTVVGVAPASFRDAPAEQEFGDERVDAWIPLGLAHHLLGQFGPEDRAGAILWGIGRLKPGVSMAEARADIDGIGRRLAATYPDTDRGFGLMARPLKDQLVGELYAPVGLLAAGSLFLLLIGCANASNLLLARLVSRQRELAVRIAHGATARRLVVQLLAESLLLAIMAGALGISLAAWSVSALSRAVGQSLPAAVSLAIDVRTAAGSLALALGSGLLLGVLPAVLASRLPPRESLNQGSRLTGSAGRRLAARALVAGEVGLAIVLLSGAGLLVKSLHRLVTIDLGFRPENLLTMRMDLRSERYASREARGRFGRSLVEGLDRAPGIESVTLWGPSMIGRATWVVEAVREGAAADDPANVLMSWRHSVNPGALSNLGIRLRRGRDFTWQDDERAPLVAIVSESTARAQWPGEDPIGKRFRALRLPGWATVVGIAADARHRQRLDLTDAAMGIPPSGIGPQRDVYFPYLQLPNPTLVVAVRTKGDPGVATRSLRDSVRRMDPTLPVYDVAPLERRLARQEQGSRALTALAGAYAAVALFLSAIGLYGVLAHSVERRTREIGIRRALGAAGGNVIRLILGEGLAPTLFGIGAGLGAALLLSRSIASLLFGVAPTDPAVFAGISLLLLAIAAAACAVPARRAIRVDPMVAMRGE